LPIIADRAQILSDNKVVGMTWKLVLSCAAFLLFAASTILAADKPKLPEGPGKAVTIKLCGSCHATELVMNRRETVDGWSAVIEDMIRRGAKGSDDEFGEVLDYLVANFPKTAAAPKINVNKAVAKDLATGLGITDAQAAAIVQYREANGNFKSVEDLQKVPGIDSSLIEAKKSKLEF
jgi:competence protein ComEA